MKLSWWEIIMAAVRALSDAGWCDVCYTFSGYLHTTWDEERWCGKCLSMCQD